MIRILQMIGSLNVGGSQTMLMNIYRNIDRERMQFDFVLDHPGERYFAADVEALGGRIYEMPGFTGRNAGEIRRAWDAFLTAHPEYRVLHSHVRSYASLYIPVAKRHGLKTIIHSHNTSNGFGARALMKRALQYPLRHQADMLMACSMEAGRWLFGEKACASEKFKFVPNAVDLERFHADEGKRREYREALGLEGKFVVGHVGRMQEAKNHMFLLDVFARVHGEEPDSALLLVGDGELRGALREWAQQLGVSNAVYMTGNRNDVPELLGAMDVFAFPSLWEGLPVTLIEAQAAGLPCVISDRISTDVDVSELVRRLPIDDAGRWAAELLEKRPRKDVTEDIIRAGFDIKSSAAEISRIYTRLAQEADAD